MSENDRGGVVAAGGWLAGLLAAWHAGLPGIYVMYIMCTFIQVLY